MFVTPRVRATAEKFGLDVTELEGTGVGGRVTLNDVYTLVPEARPAPRSASADLVPATGKRFTRPSLMHEVRSRFTHIHFMIDAYAVNPLIEDLKQSSPDDYAAAVAFDRNVPTMFSGGDVPLFTAAGFAPELVLRLPSAIRFHAAATTDAAEVAAIFERCGGGNLEAVQQAGTWLSMTPETPTERLLGGEAAYLRRVKSWLNARHVIPIPKAIVLFSPPDQFDEGTTARASGKTLQQKLGNK